MNNTRNKWSKRFADRRRATEKPVIELSILEQQEILDDIERLEKENHELNKRSAKRAY